MKKKLSDIVRRFNTERLDGAFDEPELDESSRLDTGVDLPGGLTSVLAELKAEVVDEDVPLYAADVLRQMDELPDNIKAKLMGSEGYLKRLLYRATHDSFLHVLNRYSFDEDIVELIDRRLPFAMGVVDIDGFKRFNDMYGHDRGDIVLIRLAETAKQVVTRNRGKVYRIGGETLGVIVPEADRRRGYRILDSLRRTVEASDLTEHRNCNPDGRYESYASLRERITVSAGVVAVDKIAADFGIQSRILAKGVIYAADNALY
ncbi:GGDEF domain-containing protein, partial [Candidatus Woesearchaeota archaeon]|nr:GGDEF domain-containing protein [Candidatus Woesearchaeota archaeon]